MKKKLIVLFSVLIVGSIAIVCCFNFTNLKHAIFGVPHVKVSYYAKDSSELIKDSPVIVVAQVSNHQTQITYQGVDFVKTGVNVKQVLKGANLAGKEITLLQTVCDEDPTVEKGSTVLLFLEAYDGPVTENAYVCKGLYQGQYKVSGDTFAPVKSGNSDLASDLKSLGNLNSLTSQIQAMK
jgi:hypothetical protein